MSAKKGSERKGAGHSRHSEHSKTPSSSSGGGRGGGSGRGGRSGDLGRALRSVYDDTLREPVPDDFANLIGKLS